MTDTELLRLGLAFVLGLLYSTFIFYLIEKLMRIPERSTPEPELEPGPEEGRLDRWA